MAFPDDLDNLITLEFSVEHFLYLHFTFAMGIFYNISDKQLLKDRNTIFKEVGLNALEIGGFVEHPFKTSWFGEYYSGIDGYIYEFGRISKHSLFESLKVFIVKGDSHVKIYINIFKLSPELKSIEELHNYEGTKYGIPPNSLTKMQLRIDDYKGIPFFSLLYSPKHKIGRYFTKSGYEAELRKLKKLIQSDLENIDRFVARWHELHKPNHTDWEGNLIE